MEDSDSVVKMTTDLDWNLDVMIPRRMNQVEMELELHVERRLGRMTAETLELVRNLRRRVNCDRRQWMAIQREKALEDILNGMADGVGGRTSVRELDAEWDRVREEVRNLEVLKASAEFDSADMEMLKEELRAVTEGMNQARRREEAMRENLEMVRNRVHEKERYVTILEEDAGTLE